MLTPSIISASSATVLPVRSIPGSYGLPLLGPLKDRMDYFWFQGPKTFFLDRMEKHKSTVFRTNVPPTFPFFLRVNPQMIAILDCKSFSYLFDMSVVEKKNVLVGDYMPSVSYTGDIRVLAYLDTEEKQHSSIKSFVMDTLKMSSKVWVSEFLQSVDIFFDAIDKDLSGNSSAGFVVPMQQCILRFLMKSIVGADPAVRPDIEKNGFAILDTWLALQLIPTQKVGVIPQPLEELLLHSFPFPSFIANWGYRKLYDFVDGEGKETVSRAMKEYNLTKDEAIHNLLFVLGFNAFGGFSIFIPTLLSTIGRDKTGLREKLRDEVRRLKGDVLSFETVRQMELVMSTVYEVLRLNPPVELQYARARKDFILSSHESAFAVKKGELLCGYQTLAMRDPVVFDRPEEFTADRFTGEKGKELLNYLFWSNGPQTGTPSSSNKQCAAKDYVVATAGLLVAAIFKRYDDFTIDDQSVSFTKLVKATEDHGQ
ncbi:fatty acid hydroperoxide lyase, chloroplastic [Aristolochia californica]|uniref:fatty acid hydroperoxide lyase, chloroplastic n=1 Tax=Aristolochia californica TaxID=171875 RepID=UPI0035E37E96